MLIKMLIPAFLTAFAVTGSTPAADKAQRPDRERAGVCEAITCSDAQAEKLAALHEEMKAEREAFKAKRKALRDEMKASRAAYKAKVDAVLTPGQRTELEAKRSGKKDRAAKRHRKGSDKKASAKGKDRRSAAMTPNREGKRGSNALRANEARGKRGPQTLKAKTR